MQSIQHALISVLLLMAPTQQTAPQVDVPVGFGTIRGAVVDAATGVPLAGVLVRVPESSLETVTDSEGRFAMTRVPAGARLLYVTFIGYGLSRREVRVDAGDVTELTVPLVEGAGAFMEEIIVTPVDAKDPFARRNGDLLVPSRQTIGSAELQELRGVLADDAFRAAQSLGGVATGDDFRSEFSVRGGSFRSLGVAIDGLFSPMLLHTVRAVHDGGSVAMINSDLLERVTLESGAYAQRYGQRTGAHLDFEVREGSRDRTLTRSAISGTNAAFLIEGPIGASRRGSWIASVRKSYMEWLIRRIDPNAPGTFGFADGQAKIVFDLTPRHQLQALVIAGRSHASELDEAVSSSANSFHDGFHRATGAQASWRAILGPVLMTQRASVVSGHYSNLSDAGLETAVGGDRSLTWRGEASWLPSPRARLDLGGHFERREGRQQRRTFESSASLASPQVRNRFAFDMAGHEAGAWARGELTLGKFTIAPGARLDSFDLVPGVLGSPWLQAEWRVFPRMRVHAAAGVYQQYPDFDQLAAPNPLPLRAERARHADAAVEFRLDDHTRLDVAAYRRDERDVLRTVGQEYRIDRGLLVVPVDRPTFRQSLHGEASGIEVTLERRDPNRLSGWLAYSFGDARYQDAATGESFWGDFDQRHTLNAYGHLRLSNRTSVGAKLRIGSNFPLTGYFEQRDGAYYVSDRRNELRLPTYSRLDVRVNRTFNYSRRRLTLFFEVLNVMARTNYRAAEGSVNRRTQVAKGITEALFPIVPSMGLLIEF